MVDATGKQSAGGGDARFHSLFVAMSEGVALHELVYDVRARPVDYRILDVNPAFERQTGIARAAVVGKLASAAYGTGIAPFLDIYAQVVLSGEATSFEQSFEPLRRRFRISVFRPGAGQFATVFEDITERARAEEALRYSEEIFAHFMENSPIYVFFKDQEIRAIRLSKNYETLLGTPLAELLGKSMAELFPSDLARSMVEDDKRVLREGKPITVEEEFNGRHYSTVKFPVYVEGEPRYLAGYTMDVTERKRADALLRTRLRMSELAQTDNLDDLLQYALDTAEGITGSEVGFFHFVDPDQEHLTLQAWSSNTVERMCTAEGKGQHYPIIEAGVWVDAFHQRMPMIYNDYPSLEHKRGLPPGHAPVKRLLVVPILRAGKVTEILGVGNKAGDYAQADIEAVQVIAELIQDLVERQRAKSALRESEVRFRVLVEQAGDGFELYDDQGRILDANAMSCAMLGYTREELLQRKLFDIDPVVRRDRFDSVFQMLRSHPPMTFESVHQRKDGTTFPVEVTASVVVLGGKAQSLALVRDISARKRMEEAHLQTQKLEALGTLAGGIAHDLNNALAAILGNAELLRQDLGPDQNGLESVGEINKAGRRAKALVQQILTFGRRQMLERKVISLRPVAQEAVRLLRATLPAGVGLSLACDPELPPVLADAHQIEQVLLNLCTNAWHATEVQEGAGEIEIRLESHTLAADQGEARPLRPMGDRGRLRPGRYVRLVVRDNGQGMDDATRSRMFEPFFTTKTAEKGTGLGLSVVHGIIQAHDGTIEVQSELGVGTTLAIYLPEASAAGAEAKERLEGAARSDGGEVLVLGGEGRRVLYIDDDEAIVLMMTRLLQRQDYRVSAYTDPHAALAAVQAEPGQFDLAVTDYNMPGMSGLEVAAELRRMRPEMTVLLASGYVTEELRSKAAEVGVNEVIYKPNTVVELCDAVARYSSARNGGGNQA